MHRIDTLTVNNSPMEVFMYAPDGNGPHPGVVVAMHIPLGHTGIENDPFTLKVCERLAENGYAVACPFIFHWWPKEAEMSVKRDEFRDDWTTLDMQATFSHLANQENVNSDKIGIIGHCWGGRVAWLSACHNQSYKAAVVLYAGRVKVALGPNTPAAIELTNNIKAPLLGHFGNDDSNPSPEDVNDYEAALKEAKVEYKFHRYDNAGHGFQDFNAEDRYRETQSEEAWKITLDFFKEKLS